MQILKLDSDMNEQEKFLNSMLPEIKIKFRQQFCVSGNAFEYKDLSKVTINKKTLDIIPKIFSEDIEAQELDYIGLYSIGILELLYLGSCCYDDSEVANSVISFYSAFTESFSDILKDINDIEKIHNMIESLDNENGQFNEMFNIYFSLRTDYDRYCRTTLLKCANWLMILYTIDPKTYWTLFFDIMNVVKFNMLTIFNEYINDDLGFTIQQPWFNKDKDLRFGSIEYTIPNSAKIRRITDCRGLSIYICWSLYYRLLYNYGYDCEMTPAIKHNDDRILKHIDEKIKSCFGDDSQSKILKGIGTKQCTKFSVLDTFIYDQPTNVKFTIDDNEYSRDYYEERILFMRKYGLKEFTHGMNINVHYSSAYTIFEAIGEMFYMTSTIVIVKHNNKTAKTILELTNTNKQLETNLKRQKQITQETIEKFQNAKYNEIEQLKQKLEETELLLQSKNEIIDTLVSKNKELNKYVASIYDDDFEIDTTNEAKKSLEEMVSELNDFRIALIGGRWELPSKLNELGWTNIVQYDNNNLVTGLNGSVDFTILNTKFTSHTLSQKAESLVDADRRMSYNGTNPEKLIEAMYDFVMKYMNN